MRDLLEGNREVGQDNQDVDLFIKNFRLLLEQHRKMIDVNLQAEAGCFLEQKKYLARFLVSIDQEKRIEVERLVEELKKEFFSEK